MPQLLQEEPKLGVPHPSQGTVSHHVPSAGPSGLAWCQWITGTNELHTHCRCVGPALKEVKCNGIKTDLTPEHDLLMSSKSPSKAKLSNSLKY